MHKSTFYYWIYKSHHISLNLIVRLIDQMVETTLYIVQDLSSLCTVDLSNKDRLYKIKSGERRQILNQKKKKQ